MVGSASTSTGSSSFLLDGKKMTALSGLGAYGINDSGQIAGTCGPNPGGQIVANAYDTSTYQGHALLLTPN